MAGNRSEDVGWRFGKAVEGNKKEIECVFCGKIIKGGITRLKEHLAHKAGNVAPCPNVTADVKIEMNKLLIEFKEKKKDKARRSRDLEDEIERNINRDDYIDEDEDDVFDFARRQSLQQHQFDYDQRNYRASGYNRYETGGGSQSLNPQQMRRSATVRETGLRGSRPYDDLSSPTARLRAVEIGLEIDNPKKKQSKLSTKWLKETKKKVMRAFGNWMIDTNQSFNAIESKYTQPLINVIQQAGPNVRAPTSYELSDVYLVEECRMMKEYISTFANSWKQRGVTLMCDGWSSSTRIHIINFLVYSNRTTVFHKSVDASNVPSRDTDYYFKIIKKVVEEIGPEKIVQVVTDNEAALKAAGRRLEQVFPHMYWTACAAHCLDLILKDLSEKTNIGKVIETARKISAYIYKYDWAVNLMQKFTNGGHIVRPGPTRFATNYLSLESLVKHKNALREMWLSPEWLSHKLGRSKDALAITIREYILSETVEAQKFWKKTDEVLGVHEPLFQVLRLVDGDNHPTMGFIYEAMDRAKLAIQNNSRYYLGYWKIIDNRWNFQLHHELHAAGYLLNPQFAYRDNEPDPCAEVMQGFRAVVYKVESDVERQVKAVNQLFVYLSKQQSFGSSMAQLAVKKTPPAEWWMAYGESVPELQRIAIRVLSQTTSASNCERNWSMFSLVHTKLRNRLTYKKLNLIVYLRYNMKLKLKHLTKDSHEHIQNSFNPINLDKIFDEEDPVNKWFDEVQPPLFEDNDTDWLRLDGNDNGTPIDVQEDPVTGVHVQFRYSVDGSEEAQDNATEGNLSTPSSGGSGGNEGRNEFGTSRASGYSGDYSNANFPVNERTNIHSTEETRHTYQRRGKEHIGNSVNQQQDGWSEPSHESFHQMFLPINSPPRIPYPTGWSEPYEYHNYIPSLSSILGESYTQPNMPYEGVHIQPYAGEQTPQQSSHEPYSDGSYNREGNSIINQGTMNYGGVHYHQPNYYNENSSSNNQSWTDTASSNFFPQQAYNNDHYNDGNNQEEPHRRSFWY